MHVSNDIASAQKPVDTPAAPERLSDALRRAFFYSREKSLARLEGVGVTERQAAALLAIARAQPMTQAELALAIGMEPANVHGVLRRLSDKAFVEMRRDPSNAKKIRITLSREGRKLVSQLVQTSSEAESDLLAGLTPVEEQQLRALLHKLTA